jgi:hypothetical protein
MLVRVLGEVYKTSEPSPSHRQQPEGLTVQPLNKKDVVRFGHCILPPRHNLSLSRSIIYIFTGIDILRQFYLLWPWPLGKDCVAAAELPLTVGSKGVVSVLLACNGLTVCKTKGHVTYLLRQSDEVKSGEA